MKDKTTNQLELKIAKLILGFYPGKILLTKPLSCISICSFCTRSERLRNTRLPTEFCRTRGPPGEGGALCLSLILALLLSRGGTNLT